MPIRKYSRIKDARNAHRIWQEVGWIKKDRKEEKAMDILIDSGNADVYDLNGSIECLVISVPGTLLYKKNRISLSAVTSVTTSRLIRGQGIAGKVLASRISSDAAGGAKVASLGMFEQGYYNRFGFGTGCYENWVSFDPANLDIKTCHRIPVRLEIKDSREMFKCYSRRMLFHGGINLDSQGHMKSLIYVHKNAFGFGYRNKKELTHFLWIVTENVHRGPYKVLFMGYRNYDQYLELLSLLKSLNSNLRIVMLREPRRIQFQDFLKKPFYYNQLTENSNRENRMHTEAYWQMRIIDLTACVRAVEIRDDPLEFNLRIDDPIDSFLLENSKWRGCGGNYTVRLSRKSDIKSGYTEKLPLLRSGIGAFSRMWLGVLPASSLAVSDNFSAPQGLIDRLDRAFDLPLPDPDLDY